MGTAVVVRSLDMQYPYLFATAVDLVQNMAAGVAPRFHTSPNPFLSKVYSRLPFFCVAKKLEGNHEVQLRGRDAVEHLWAQIAKQTSKDPSLKDLEQVLVFAWLLPQQQQTAIAELTKEIYAQAGGSMAGPTNKKNTTVAKGSSSSSSSTARSSKQAACSIAEAAQMFK